MNRQISITFLFFLLSSISCNQVSTNESEDILIQPVNYEQEKAAILETINNETKAAFSRDYKGWRDKWLHESFVSKTYIKFSDSSFSETLGWKEIDEFVRTYIEEHPEPDSIPTLLDDLNVRLYGNGAWVSFEQNDPDGGFKRETRLMEKVNNQWKIAGMHTTVYGIEKED